RQGQLIDQPMPFIVPGRGELSSELNQNDECQRAKGASRHHHQSAPMPGITGPRDVLGSQRVRMHGRPGMDLTVLVAFWPLRAEDVSRSGVGIKMHSSRVAYETTASHFHKSCYPLRLMDTRL